jgi:hypothetical protein
MKSPSAHFTVQTDSPSYIFKASDTTQQNYIWSFGDGTGSTGYKTTHHYNFTTDLQINVSLKVGLSPGCVSVFDTTIKIHHFSTELFDIKVYPNPFLNSTEIHVTLISPAHIRILIYDEIGKYIGTFVEEQALNGKHSYKFDAVQYNLSQGEYFFKIVVDDYVKVVKVIRY